MQKEILVIQTLLENYHKKGYTTALEIAENLNIACIYHHLSN